MLKMIKRNVRKNITRELSLFAGIFQVLALTIPLQAESDPTPEILDAGLEGYDLNCALCHYDGHANRLNPSLFESPKVVGPTAPLIDVILRGQSGESMADGRVLGGIMPPQATLSDEEIAEILTYVRHHFGNSASPVTPEEVAKRRSKLP